MRTPVSADAPSKIILLGEHAVVHGSAALAVPIRDVRARVSVVQGQEPNTIIVHARDLNTTYRVHESTERDEPTLVTGIRHALAALGVKTYPTLAMTIHSDIPVASGMGSGAAVTTAMIRALYRAYQRDIASDELNDMVFALEKLYHGTPSGIDNTVIVHEKPICYVRNEPVRFLTVGSPMMLLVGDTGHPAPTKQAVQDVADLLQHDPMAREAIKAIDALVRQALESLSVGSAVELGRLMSQNHVHLQNLTVSSPELDRLVTVAEAAGAMGAKLSGGGRGGNMIALVNEKSASKVEAALYAAGAVKVYQTILL